MNLPELLSAARGERPADLLLRNARIVNVFSGEIEPGDIAIFQGRIAGIGVGYRGQETLDLGGAFIAPGLIDAHVHIESSLCVPCEFAAAVLPRGVTTVVTDPHEIANVMGVPGIRFMAADRKNTPLRIEIMAPSCVPATALASGGAVLTADDLAALLADGTVHGLAEVMNFPAVVAGQTSILAKLAAFAGRPIDGHCPQVRGLPLNAYAAAGIGSDHESITADEAAEKLARGLYVFIRQASNARNLAALLPLMNSKNNRRICFCTDDRQPAELLEKGSVDQMVRFAISSGIDPVDAIRAATLNSAEAFGLPDRGAIAPGRRADLMVFDDLAHPTATDVFVAGKSVRNFRRGAVTDWSALLRSGTVDWGRVDLQISARGNRVRVIGALADQLVTEHRLTEANIVDGVACADPQRDLLKMAVIERHGGTKRVGLGFIQGFGLKRGAIAGTVAHDHHNLVVIGADDVSMQTAGQAALLNGGGLAVADATTVLARLPLPVAGLMSDQPIAAVAAGYSTLLAAARELGSTLSDPFMAMSFMALEVIPSLKLTDLGLVDVERFQHVDLFE